MFLSKDLNVLFVCFVVMLLDPINNLVGCFLCGCSHLFFSMFSVSRMAITTKGF